MSRHAERCLMLMVLVIAVVCLEVAPTAARAQPCNDCYQYEGKAPQLPSQAQCCFSDAASCNVTDQHPDAELVTQNQSQCFILPVPTGYVCDQEANFPCDSSGGGGGGGAGGGGNSCTQGGGQWCPPSCSSCKQLF